MRRGQGFLFVLPWLIGFVLWSAGPLLASALLSLTHWDLLSPPRFVGAAHYARLLHDPLVRTALANSLYLTLLGVPLSLTLALALALGLHGVAASRAHLLRTVLYLPSQLPAAASAVLWLWIFNPDYGIANRLLGLVGVSPSLWLLSPVTAKPTLILIGFWGVGTGVLLLAAGLAAIPLDVLEAARLDGARGWAHLRHIVLPLLSPVLLFNLVVGVVATMQAGFTQVYVMTDGGPDNSTLTLPLYMFRVGWRDFHMGYAAAIAWLFVAVLLVLVAAAFLLTRRYVHYEVGGR